MVRPMPHGRAGSKEGRSRNGIAGDCFESRHGTLADACATIQRDEHSKLYRAEEWAACVSAARTSQPQSNGRMAAKGWMMSASIPATPSFIYGTAWKKEAKAAIVKTAVKAGSGAIDTANQPRHYEESLIGEALTSLASDGIRRDSLFLQTKFTPLNGHDHRVPYDPAAMLREQVRQSFESSLRNLKTDYVDSYLLRHPDTIAHVQRLVVHAEQVLFQFPIHLLMVLLTRTTHLDYMGQDFRLYAIEFTAVVLQLIESIETSGKYVSGNHAAPIEG